MSKKTMQKFMDWLQYKVTPAVQKFTERPWVHGFSAGIVKCLPFILTGCLIFFYNVVQPYFPNILPNLSAVSNYTFSMLSLLVAFMMVYQEMGSLKHRNYQVVGLYRYSRFYLLRLPVVLQQFPDYKLPVLY